MASRPSHSITRGPCVAQVVEIREHYTRFGRMAGILLHVLGILIAEASLDTIT